MHLSFEKDAAMIQLELPLYAESKYTIFSPTTCKAQPATAAIKL